MVDAQIVIIKLLSLGKLAMSLIAYTRSLVKSVTVLAIFLLMIVFILFYCFCVCGIRVLLCFFIFNWYVLNLYTFNLYDLADISSWLKFGP